MMLGRVQRGKSRYLIARSRIQGENLKVNSSLIGVCDSFIQHVQHNYTLSNIFIQKIITADTLL